MFPCIEQCHQVVVRLIIFYILVIGLILSILLLNTIAPFRQFTELSVVTKVGVIVIDLLVLPHSHHWNGSFESKL